MGYRASSKIGGTVKTMIIMMAMSAKGECAVPKFGSFGSNRNDCEMTVPLLLYTDVLYNSPNDTNMTFVYERSRNVEKAVIVECLMFQDLLKCTKYLWNGFHSHTTGHIL